MKRKYQILIVITLLSLHLSSARAVSLFAAPWIPVQPGGQTEFPIFVSNASHLTVGKFTLTVTSDPGVSLPTVVSVKGGQAIVAAGGCGSCPDWQSSGVLATNPVLSVPALTPVKSAFVLNSGCQEGVSLPCPAGDETGGVTGNYQEIARITLSLPNDAPANQTYQLTLSDIEFSDAASQLFSLSPVSDPIAVSDLPDGDLNGDESSNAGDAIVVLRYAIGSANLTPDQILRADVNGDGVVNAGDAVVILRRAVGLIIKYPME